MTRVRSRTSVLRALIGMAVTLGVAGGTARAQDTSDPSLNPLSGLEKTKLRSFLEAPLFDPSRRLPPVNAPIATPPPPPPIIRIEPPPRIRLLGVIQGNPTVAFVKMGDDTRTVMLHRGDKLGEWVVAILPVSIRLRSKDRAFDYALFSKGGASAVPVTADKDDDETR